MSRPWRLILMSMFVLSLGLALVGCANANTVRQNVKPTEEGARRLGARAARDDRNDVAGKTANMNDTEAKASQLAERAELVKNVKAANVQLYGDDALVGIEIENAGNRGIIEKQVYSALRIQYPAYRLHITSDQDLRNRIKVLGAEAASKDGTMRSMSSDMSALIKAIDKSFHNRK
ncbi:YhcN/YlaJ family sporulation lipoprotein [Paenibacillus harenae]|uniref:Sporulation protein n=1 Tax=Paenibacillus harenae TaxID=306543 RepID=A0ABT9U703_PAEHA|nr:YhcN/YlaJ family sporulation lipoprotein [Paenibacillus harenae]MDQ0115427.1 hypothetical protein [Paenibacillus harenae]